MRYLVTLNNVKRSDLESLGFRAVDLALLREKRINIPLTFIINNQAYQDFIAENGLKPKIDKAFQNKKPADAYKEVLELFEEGVIPKEMEAEFFDAYESLTIEPGVSANKIVGEWEYPIITLIRSPSYLLSAEDNEGIMQNIKGAKDFLQALKKIWASFYSPKSVNYRKKAGITDSLGFGVIVQKMKNTSHSAVSYSCSELDYKTIIVKSFMGFHDFDQEILGKDVCEVDADTLMINKAEINVQEYSIVRNPETEKLERKELREQGSRQKLDDKQVYEIARVAKRSKSFIDKDLKMYIGIKDTYTYVFLANRMILEERKFTEEKEELKVDVSGKEAKIIEQSHESVHVEEDAEPLRIPDIISKEEADEEAKEKLDEELRIEMDEVIHEEKKVDEELERDLQFLEEIETEEGEEIGKEVKEIEEAVGKELSLLEEVLHIKEIIERMEEHALNDNKESYEQEAKKIRKMIGRLRD